MFYEQHWAVDEDGARWPWVLSCARIRDPWEPGYSLHSKSSPGLGVAYATITRALHAEATIQLLGNDDVLFHREFDSSFILNEETESINVEGPRGHTFELHFESNPDCLEIFEEEAVNWYGPDLEDAGPGPTDADAG